MSTSVDDFKIASLAFGFTLGFGFLTVWTAIQQTTRLTKPWRSVYIYMVWGEIFVNFVIAIIAWLYLDGYFQPSVPLGFFIRKPFSTICYFILTDILTLIGLKVFLWVFEIQLLMQIIINRITVVVEDRRFAIKVKWGVAVLITCVNIAVFCIWIPSHLDPPVSQLYVDINKYWDRTSKIIICLVDASLNWYFLRTVKNRLVKYHGLKKYAPLVTFNFRLMIVSICMDIMIIGLMSLPNQIVYIQFHPVAYIVKLNIEMSMADLITRIAIGGERTDFTSPTPLSGHSNSIYLRNPPPPNTPCIHQPRTFSNSHAFPDQAFVNLAVAGKDVDNEGLEGIHCKRDVVVDTQSLEDAWKVDKENRDGSDELPLRALGTRPGSVRVGDMWAVERGQV
ncbi:hypothetical protein MMC18_005238 [Xylographa bjoerkii]|nr:hypothetical protein [Xylographa bjoerkii]